MMKRVTWFVTGVVAGAGSVVLVGRRIKRRVADLAPVRVAERTIDRTRSSFGRVKDAVSDGRAAMNAREQELRIRILGAKPKDGSEQKDGVKPAMPVSSRSGAQRDS